MRMGDLLLHIMIHDDLIILLILEEVPSKGNRLLWIFFLFYHLSWTHGTSCMLQSTKFAKIREKQLYMTCLTNAFYMGMAGLGVIIISMHEFYSLIKSLEKE